MKKFYSRLFITMLASVLVGCGRTIVVDNTVGVPGTTEKCKNNMASFGANTGFLAEGKLDEEDYVFGVNSESIWTFDRVYTVTRGTVLISLATLEKYVSENWITLEYDYDISENTGEPYLTSLTITITSELSPIVTAPTLEDVYSVGINFGKLTFSVYCSVDYERYGVPKQDVISDMFNVDEIYDCSNELAFSYIFSSNCDLRKDEIDLINKDIKQAVFLNRKVTVYSFSFKFRDIDSTFVTIIDQQTGINLKYTLTGMGEKKFELTKFVTGSAAKPSID